MTTGLTLMSHSLCYCHPWLSSRKSWKYKSCYVQIIVCPPPPALPYFLYLVTGGCNIFYILLYFHCEGHLVPIAARSKALVCGRSPAEIVGSNPTRGMSVCCECCLLSGRGLCNELITRPEESYWQWCVVVCDLETSWMRRPWPTGGLFCQKQTNIVRRKMSCMLYLSHWEWDILFHVLVS